jgi:hypothetical protein
MSGEPSGLMVGKGPGSQSAVRDQAELDRVGRRKTGIERRVVPWPPLPQEQRHAQRPWAEAQAGECYLPPGAA